jgi:carbamoyl-phosphate synthase large subunit
LENRYNIGITGTGSLIGQSIIKSIIRSDLKDKLNIIGFDYYENTVGSFWCDENFILPDILKIDNSENQLIDFIISKILQFDLRLLFIGVDFELPIFSRNKALIERKTNCKVLVSSEEVIEIANDKYLTYKFLRENRLSYPNSYLPEELSNLKDLSFPLIVKPRKGARSVGVSLVNSVYELENAIKSVESPIIQQYIGSVDNEFTCGTIFLDDKIKHIIPLRRYLKQGNTHISYYDSDFPNEIKNYLIDVCKILKPFGACNFQLRITENQEPMIFEINSRHSGTTYIRSLFGFREVEYIINYILFNKEIDFNVKEGTVVRYFDEYFIPKNSDK